MAVSLRPRFSIIIPSYNGLDLLLRCLESLAHMHPVSGGKEWIVVDNGSTDHTVHKIRRRFPQVKVVCLPYNQGFAAAIQAGVRVANGEYLVFLNNDMRVSSGWLGALEQALGFTGAACATGKILDRTGSRIDFVEGILLFDGHALQRYQGADARTFAHWTGYRSAFIACGGNMAVKKDVYESLGGFDEDFFAYTEDVDFSWRLRAAGHEIVFVPEAVTFHEHQATSSRFGPYRRGFLYERNAFWCLYKNIDGIFFHTMIHLAWITLLHRTRSIVSLHEPRSAAWLADPFLSPEEGTRGMPPRGKVFPSGFQSRWELWRQWLRKGMRSLEQRGFRETLRRGLQTLGDRGHGPSPKTWASEHEVIEGGCHPYIRSQLQALWTLSMGFEALGRKRQRVQSTRKVPDAKLFEQFPPWVVTTYPGDDELFASPWFREQLPKDIPFRHGTLEDVHGDTAVQRHHSHL